jgi:hypothetical protein
VLFGLARLFLRSIFPQIKRCYRKSKSLEPIPLSVSLFIVSSCENLLDFLQDGNYSTSLPTSTVRSLRPCHVLSNNKQVFAFSTINVGQINFNTFNPKLQNLYVIYPLGLVESGNCCLAFSSNGSVVKMFSFVSQSY